MPLSNSGSPFPLGVTPVEGGVNVAVVSRHGTRIFFCWFEAERETRFELASRQGDVHYGFIPGVRIGQLYGLRADGPYDANHLFDVSKLLIDPYATALDRSFTWHPDLAVRGCRNLAHRAEMHCLSSATACAAFAPRDAPLHL